jgi:Skp family chaperone for outer membrane proteins
MLKTVTASLPKRFALLALCAGSLALAPAHAQAQGAKIGWVSTERLFSEST